MRIRVRRAFLCSVIVALLVVVLTIIEVPCPICQGTGVLLGAKGLEVKGIEYELVNYEGFEVGCGYWWRRFAYMVNISLVNDGITPSYGYVVVVFDEPISEQPAETPDSALFIIPVYIKIPAQTAENVERTLVFEGLVPGQFYGFYGEPHRLSVKIAEKIGCPYCSEKARLSFIEWVKTIIQ